MNRHSMYLKLARILCFICHGYCCSRGIMSFEATGHNLTYIGIDKTYRCSTYDSWTGGCKHHDKEDRPTICKVYKCSALNLLSRLLGEPEWDWKL